MDVPTTTSDDFLSITPAESVDKPKRNLKRALSSDAENTEGIPKPKMSRKYGTNKKHTNLPPEIVEEKRLRANEQERVRQKQIADALEILKSLDMPFNPNMPNHKEDSKLYTICTASAYIAALNKMIEDHDNGIVHPEQILVPSKGQLSVPPHLGPMHIYRDVKNEHISTGVPTQPVPYRRVSSHTPIVDNQQQSYFGMPRMSSHDYPPRRVLTDATNYQHQGSVCSGTNQPLNSRIYQQHQMQGGQHSRYGLGTSSGFCPTTHEVMTHHPVARYYTPSTPTQMPTIFSPNDKFMGMSPGTNGHNPDSMVNISPVEGSMITPPHLHSTPQYNRSIPLHSTPQCSTSIPLPQNFGSPSPVIRQPFFKSPTPSPVASQHDSGYGSSFASGNSSNNGISFSNIDKSNNSMNYNLSFLNLSPFQQSRFTQ